MDPTEVILTFSLGWATGFGMMLALAIWLKDSDDKDNS